MSMLKPSDSMMLGVGIAGLVSGFYSMNVGSLSEVHMTAANDQNIATSIRKTGFISLALVSGAAWLARDMNIAIFGYSSIVGNEIAYRHAHMASPQTGQMVIQPTDYADAGTSFTATAQQTAYQN